MHLKGEFVKHYVVGACMLNWCVHLKGGFVKHFIVYVGAWHVELACCRCKCLHELRVLVVLPSLGGNYRTALEFRLWCFIHVGECYSNRWFCMCT